MQMDGSGLGVQSLDAREKHSGDFINPDAYAPSTDSHLISQERGSALGFLKALCVVLMCTQSWEPSFWSEKAALWIPKLEGEDWWAFSLQLGGGGCRQISASDGRLLWAAV
jgi:hypothetical protein